MKLDQDILRQKIVRLALAALLLMALVLIWNWDTSTDSISQVANNTPAPTQTADPVTPAPAVNNPPVTPVEPTPEPEPTEPFEITLPAGVTGPNIVTEGATEVYKYQFADGALFNVYLDGSAVSTATDITWQYSATAGAVSVVERLESLCAAGTPSCTAGNGQIEILAKPASGTNAKLVVKIVDPNAKTKTIPAAAAFYETIVNTIRIN